MRYSLLASAIFAATVVAGPLRPRDLVVVHVTVTVPAGGPAPSTTAPAAPDNTGVSSDRAAGNTVGKLVAVQPAPVKPVAPVVAAPPPPPAKQAPVQVAPSTGSSSTGTSSNTGGATDDSNVQALQAMNAIRAQYGAQPLQFDAQLAADAASNANTCDYHESAPSGEGQNIGALSGGDTSMAAMVQRWGPAEAPHYPSVGGDGDFSGFPIWGHWSVIVWKSTTHAGCAAKACDPLGGQGFSGTYFVCNFSPPGNVKGSFSANVQVP